MTSEQLHKKAVAAINSKGCLLVFPLANKPEPKSLWAQLYPRTKMRWEWDSDGDNRVASLWHLREQLSRSRQVVYTKWFQNRATLLSFEVFENLLAYFDSAKAAESLGGDSREILEYLQQDSPMSTRQIKAAAELEGRLLESSYNRAMKPLWQRLIIVAFGEFEDSSFPSLGIGASAILFEESWRRSQAISSGAAERFLRAKLGENNPFYKFAVKVRQ
jgi:hypothetical protein